MSAQQNYNEALNKLQQYYNLRLMSSEDIATFDEAKRLGSVPWSIGSGFPTEAAEKMKTLLADIEKRQQKAANAERNNGSAFRPAIGR